MRRCTRSAVALCTVASSSASVQRRWQYMQNPGKRDQDAFLAQFDPLDVLCLDDTCRAADVHAAHKRLTAKYGPQGPSPDPKLLDRVKRAHQVLSDPSSNYYARAHTTETDKQRLQIDMMPEGQRKVFQIHIMGCTVLILAVLTLVVTLALRPMKKVHRAATR